ncbi:putative sugar kinase [Actinokineospora spheciospongiae]|uniref:Putative sugar kinase n=1 Tax=Actinokineospora spheciospongiae TaxID=909613 RepID=W7IUM4_9PSEU|nr:ROK family protein [Actinokineospora spheciospongiae]EWC64053.1 putative sugar kinase [Actinokineospora spheciospongiae]
MRTIGVDVGGTSVRAGVVDEHGTVLDTARGTTPPGEAALEDAICAVVSELLGRHRVGAVGLAVAGFIANDRRTVLFAPHLAWRSAPVADRIAARLGLPVVLEHDANAAGLAEHRFGALRGVGVGLLLALGTGIGAALLVDGELYRGAHGVAPELGHLCLVPGGRPCECGKSGCWERYCSGTALAATATDLLARAGTHSPILSREAARDPGAITGRAVAAAAREGDPVATAAMSDLAGWLATGLSLIADVYDPELVVLGGGLSESAPLFLDEARDRYHHLITGTGHRPPLRLRTAHHADDAGLIGAATLAATHS